jgi:hypothetical protein
MNPVGGMVRASQIASGSITTLRRIGRQTWMMAKRF